MPGLAGRRATLACGVSAGIQTKGTTMSLGDNLQHLRAARGMTQEQLATLVGVSLQSIDRWESERARPDMDKLLRLTMIFGCTLDELVAGDLTEDEAEPEKTASEKDALAGVLGYDEHRVKTATRIGAGCGAALLGVALAALVKGLAPAPLPEDACSVVALLAGIVAGVALIVSAAANDSAFKRAHPFVESLYTAEQEGVIRRIFSNQLVVGIGAFLAGAFATSLGDSRYFRALSVLLFADGVFLIVRGLLLVDRVDVEGYNVGALPALTEEGVASIVGEERAPRVLSRVRRKRLAGVGCGIIVTLAVITGVYLLFFRA